MATRRQPTGSLGAAVMPQDYKDHATMPRQPLATTQAMPGILEAGTTQAGAAQPGSLMSASMANIGAAPRNTYYSPGLTGRQFTGNAPAATPYGDFIAPTAANFEHSPDYQYLQDEQARARQRSAAARGTLLNTGTVKGLQRDAAGIAAGDFQNAFNRSLQGYTTNRDTNAQNFGQATTQFRGDLDIFGANNRVGLDWAQFDREGQPAAASSSSSPMATTAPTSSGADTYAQYVAAQRQAQQAQQPLPPLPRRPPTREYR
jgi:hypothetical protein